MTYIEQARVRFLIDILAVDVIQSLPIILASLGVDFRARSCSGKRSRSGPGSTGFGRTSFSVSHEMHARTEDESAARVVAEASTALAYDYATERPIAVPDA